MSMRSKYQQYTEEVESFSKDTVPPSIRERNQWVTWGNDSPEKRPTQPLSQDIPAKTNAPDTWGSFEDALTHSNAGSGGRGLGFVLTESDPYLAFDIDCRDHPKRSLPDWLPSPDELGCSSWVYRTPSCQGWRIVVKVEDEEVMPDWWDESGAGQDVKDEVDGLKREIAPFFRKQYITVTDDLLSDDYRIPGEVASEDLDKWLRDAYERFTGDPAPIETHTTDSLKEPSEADSAAPQQVPRVDIYDVLSRSDYPVGERVSHPYHGSDTESNFRVDSDNNGETWRCERHKVTGHAGHLLGIDVGAISCEDAGRSLSEREWAMIYEQARKQGYDVPDPRTDDNGGGGAISSPPPGDCGGGSGADDSDENEGWEKYHQAVNEKNVQAGYQIATDLVLDEFDALTDRDSGRLYVYNDSEGIYSSYGEDLLKKALMESSRMGQAYNSGRAREILNRVEIKTKVPTEELGGSSTSLVVRNGTLDWGVEPGGQPVLKDHNPDYNALSALPVEYDPDADCPKWREFVGSVVENDMVDTVQEYIGYCLLTNEMPYHRAMMLVGDGANGKSQFLEVVRRLLGDENHTAHSLQDVSSNPNARARLFRSLANIHGDLSPASLGADSQFKVLTGEGSVSAERKYESAFDFRPTTKHIYAANEVPDVHSDDDAFFRRWLLVEFPHTFRGDDVVPQIGSKIFEQESSGILNWALEGRERLLAQEGFSNDESPDQTRNSWMEQGDSVSQFVSKRLVVTGKDEDRISSQALHERYRKFVEEEMSGGQAVSQQKLTQEVKKKLPAPDYDSHRINGRKARGFKGLSVNED